MSRVLRWAQCSTILLGILLLPCRLLISAATAAAISTHGVPPQPVHPACIEALDPSDKVTVSYAECRELSTRVKRQIRDDGHYYQYPSIEGNGDTAYAYWYRRIGQLDSDRTLLHATWNGGGTGHFDQVLVVRGMAGQFTYGDRLELEAFLPRGDRCLRGISNIELISPGHYRVVEQVTPFIMMTLEDRSEWYEKGFEYELLKDSETPVPRPVSQGRIRLQPYEDLDNCANCCFGEAVYEVDYFATPFDAIGRLIQVRVPEPEQSGEHSKSPYEDYRDASMPIQSCLLDLLQVRHQAQKTPGHLVLSSGEYQDLLTEFIDRCPHVPRDSRPDTLTDEAAKALQTYAEGTAAYNAFHRGDYDTAYEIWSKLAEEGYAEAQYSIGVMHYKGQRGVADTELAVAWFEKAAHSGSVNAMFNMGAACWNGRGREQNHREAARWWLKAAEKGLPSAQYNLGLVYLSDKGLARDYYDAAQWLRLAAANGYEGAEKVLGSFTAYLPPDDGSTVTPVTLVSGSPDSRLRLYMTPQEALRYQGDLESPGVRAIRQSIDDCLAGGISEADDPCMGHEATIPGRSIKEQPREHLSGRFALLKVQDSDSGGEVFTIMFADSPHLAFDVLVQNTLDGLPVVRGFKPREWNHQETAKRAFFLGNYLNDLAFTR